jgi:ribosomal protein L7/L12
MEMIGLVGLLLLSGVVVWTVASVEQRTAARLRALEGDVHRVMKHLGVQTAAEEVLGERGAEITALLRRRRKIEAIKRYRELTGVGLKEAKDAVDAIERG